MLPLPVISNTSKTTGDLQFGLYNFTSTADIKDRSSNTINVVNNGGVGIGSDQYGTYINFTGNKNQWLSFLSPKLNLGECEIYIRMAGMIVRGGEYDTTILDCRPNQTNGPYLLLSYTSKTSPINFYSVYNSSQRIDSTINVTTQPVEYMIRIKNTGTEFFMNGQMVANSTYTINFINQDFKLGKNTFADVVPTVPALLGKVYRFEIRSLKK